MVNSVLTGHIATILDLRFKVPVVNIMWFLFLLGVNFEADILYQLFYYNICTSFVSDTFFFFLTNMGLPFHLCSTEEPS